MVKSSLACSLQKCLGQLWGNDDFSDFTVVVEDTRYQCHRFILRACSGFFDGLLRSEMSEKLQGCTALPNITIDIFDIIMNSVYRGIDGLTQENVVSVWKAVHLLQIDYLITECEDFVMRTMSLGNYLEYYVCAKLLESEKIVKFSHNFMINNFNHFRNSDIFLEITADELYLIVENHNLNIESEELVVKSILRWVFHVPTFCSESQMLVSDNSKAKQPLSFGRDNNDNKEKDVTDNSTENKSDNMSADGTEDTVSTDNQQTNKGGSNKVDTISTDKRQLNKIDDGEVEEDNDISTSNVKGDNNGTVKNRLMELGKLLSVARLCFLRPEYIQDLLKHPVISTNKEALAELLNANFYQQKVHHDYWPPTALHRSCSDMTHAMVYVDGQKQQCNVYSLDNGSTHILCKLPIGYRDESSNVPLGISDEMLFLGKTSSVVDDDEETYFENHISIWEKSLGWKEYSAKMDGFLHKLLPHGQQFYMICRDNYEYQFRLGKILFGTLSSESVVETAVSCSRYILLMSALKDQTNKTCVMCYDSVTKETARLQDLDGPPKNIITFRCGNNVYILQSNGTLSLVISIDDDIGENDDDNVLFQFVAKLWDFDWKPYGAVVYKDQLIIFGSQTGHSKTWVKSVQDNSDFKNIKIIQIDSWSECHPMIVPKAWLK